VSRGGRVSEVCGKRERAREREGTHVSSERKMASLPAVTHNSSPSTLLSRLVIGLSSKLSSCVGASVRRSHHLRADPPRQLALERALYEVRVDAPQHSVLAHAHCTLSLLVPQHLLDRAGVRRPSSREPQLVDAVHAVCVRPVPRRSRQVPQPQALLVTAGEDARVRWEGRWRGGREVGRGGEQGRGGRGRREVGGADDVRVRQRDDAAPAVRVPHLAARRGRELGSAGRASGGGSRERERGTHAVKSALPVAAKLPSLLSRALHTAPLCPLSPVNVPSQSPHLRES